MLYPTNGTSKNKLGHAHPNFKAYMSRMWIFKKAKKKANLGEACYEIAKPGALPFEHVKIIKKRSQNSRILKSKIDRLVDFYLNMRKTAGADDIYARFWV